MNYNIVKIGNLELRGWYTNVFDNWIRSTHNYDAYIKIEKTYKGWQIYFYNGFNNVKLKNLIYDIFKEYKFQGDAEDVKQQVDKVLVKIDKIITFT